MFAAKTHQLQVELPVSMHHAIYPSSKVKSYVALLIASKAIVSFCYFLSYSILRVVHVVHFLFITKATASVVLVLVQKPFSSGKRLNKQLWLRLLRHAFLESLLSLVQLYGLSLCGPLRTILLIEHRDTVVIAVVMALVTGSGGNAKVRGAACFLFGIFSLLLLDHDETVPPSTDHPEGQAHHGVSHVLYYSLSWLGLVDHKAGVLLLVLSLCVHAAFSGASRRLAVDVGGAKRLNALSSLVSVFLLVPWAFFLRFTQTAFKVQWSHYSLPFAVIGVFTCVVDYYAEAVCTAKLDAYCTGRVASLACFMLAPLLGVLPILQIDHQYSLGVGLAWLAFVLATLAATSTPTKSARGTFVGYSASGMPLYNVNGNATEKSTRSLLLTIRAGLRQIMEESDSRKIFYFFCLNMAFTVVEMTYGIWTNSLGLISDGFHMLFDCSALVMGLSASLLARKKPSKTFPYGYGRIEVLSGFVNGLFLVVVAFVVFREALARILDPPKILTTRLLTVSVAGLAVNLLGILVFRHAHQHSHHGHHHSGTNANLQGVFLHVLADTLGSIGVIISSLLIEHLGLYVADPLCSLFISLLILASVLPLLKQTACILLLGTPLPLQRSLSAALNKVMQVPGVVSYRDPRFWQHCPQVAAASIHVQVAPSASEQKITNQVSALFRELGFVHFSVQVEKEAFFQHMSGLGNNILCSAKNCDNVKTV